MGLFRSAQNAINRAKARAEERAGMRTRPDRDSLYGRLGFGSNRMDWRDFANQADWQSDARQREVNRDIRPDRQEDINPMDRRKERTKDAL